MNHSHHHLDLTAYTTLAVGVSADWMANHALGVLSALGIATSIVCQVVQVGLTVRRDRAAAARAGARR